MAEPAPAKTPVPSLDSVISTMKKRRPGTSELDLNNPAILEEVRNYERQYNAPMPAVSLASAKFDDLERLALLDPLTELYNYRAFLKELKAELNRAKRYKQPVSLCLITIDDFEQIISQYGQLTGDAILKVAANVLRGLVREVDVSARYGDRHFVIILPQTHASGAALVAERIRQRMGNQAITHNWQNFSVTASIGIAAFPAHATEYDALIAQAGQALEFAIDRGGDRVFSV